MLERFVEFEKYSEHLYILCSFIFGWKPSSCAHYCRSSWQAFHQKHTSRLEWSETMLSVYRSATTGRSFVFDKSFPKEGQFFYAQNDKYYHLNPYGLHIGLGGNHVCFENVCAGIIGRFSFDDTTLTVEHDADSFEFDAHAVFDPEAVTAQPVLRYVSRLYAFPGEERLLYLSYAKSGRHKIHEKIYVANEGLPAQALSTFPENDHERRLTAYPTSEQTFTWAINPKGGPYLVHWGDTQLVEVKSADYNIHETLEGEAIIAKK
jgi:hypothetical protein